MPLAPPVSPSSPFSELLSVLKLKHLLWFNLISFGIPWYVIQFELGVAGIVYAGVWNLG